jgi:hypothetical protein
MKEYYTYAYLREDRTPYYIGKGKKKYKKYYTRTTALHKNVFIPPKERIIILKEFDFEFDAYKHEMYMISIFGRKDIGTGILHNRSDGGDGHSNMSEYARKRCSEIHKGKVLSEETRKKISLSHKKRGYKCSEEQKQKYSEMFSGEGNPNYGNKHFPETLKKISEGTKNKNLKTRWYVSPTGEVVEVKNLREFCEKNNLLYNSMISLHTEKCYSHKGYTKHNSKIVKVNTWVGREHSKVTCEKIKDIKSKYLYTLTDPQNKTYQVKYIKDFCEQYNLLVGSIRRVCAGKYKQHKGWTATRESLNLK